MLNKSENYDSLPEPKFSKKYKRRMNRIFREIANSSKIPYPEVDNSFERERSNLAMKLPFIKTGVRDKLLFSDITYLVICRGDSYKQ